MPLKITHAKGGGSQKLSIRMRNPCNWQLISIHVRLQFFDSILRGFSPRVEPHRSNSHFASCGMYSGCSIK
jgi:hypothetical protein